MRDALLLLAVLSVAVPATAQQGSLDINTSTQIVGASDARRGGQPALEPDAGFTLYQPAFRFGNLFVDLHGVARHGRARLGTTAIGLREVKLGGLTWSVTGGDSAFAPSLSAYRFANLFAPQVTFAGGNISGFSPTSAIVVTAGRVTMLRNIFGSDPQTLGQDLAQLQGKFRVRPRIELLAHASRVRTGNTGPYTAYVDRGADAGGGVRVRPTPTVELTADAGFSQYRRRGSTSTEQNVTALLGTKWTLDRGWLEVNAQRFSPGYFAVVNTPYLDREGAFAAGEFELAHPLRLFAGAEVFRTNIDPARAATAASSLPRGVTERVFAGARWHVGGKNFVTVRAEQGDRTARPVSRPGRPYDSDTGITTAEFQTSVGHLFAFTRYERRENLDRANGTGTYTQQTASAQVVGHVTRAVQLFGSAMFVDQARQEGGETFWQGGGGVQLQVPRRQLWVRAEGLLSRADNWGADLDVAHELYTLGLTGQLTPRTSIALDVMLDRAPQTDTPTSPWLTRSMIRLTHRMPTGAARVSSAGGTLTRRRGNASIFGVAFADWNGNGLMDSGEEPLGGVPFLYSATPPVTARTAPPAAVQVTSGNDGQFAFVNVPEGRARVSLDLSGLPVDYDAPETIVRDTEARGRPRDKLTFGLVPLGSIAGSVLQDADNDGLAGAPDTPVDGAVLVLDDGARSEQTRGGAFRFDAVRTGAHTVKLLQESLPEGSVIGGAPMLDVVLDRSGLHRETRFLVKMQKRPEIRKVFPPKVVARANRSEAAGEPATPPRAGRATARKTAPLGAVTGPTRTRATAFPSPAAASRVSPRQSAAWYAIQVAATSNRARAWELVRALQSRGVDAYLAEDADGLAKVRVGSYRSRAEALQHLSELRTITAAWVAEIGG